MTRDAALALVRAAVGDLPMVTRLAYVVEADGEGVVVEMGDGYYAIPRIAPAGYRGKTLADHTVETLRVLVETIYAQTRHQPQDDPSPGEEWAD